MSIETFRYTPGHEAEISDGLAAFGLQPGQLSDVVSTGGNAFIVELVGYAPADSAAWLGQTVEQRNTEIAILQQQRLQEWIMALRESARIIDRRDEVLAPIDEDAPPQMPLMF